MIAVRITPDMEMAVVAAPAHFRRYGFPQTPADLDAHPCIAYQFADGNHYQWELVQDGKRVTHRPEGQWAFSDSYMEAETARLGLGLAYVWLSWWLTIWSVARLYAFYSAIACGWTDCTSIIHTATCPRR